jgi:hypothetical protein
MPAAHQMIQKTQIRKYNAIVMPSGSSAGFPFHNEKNATETAMAATVATCQSRYFQVWPVVLANLPNLSTAAIPAV